MYGSASKSVRNYTFCCSVLLLLVAGPILFFLYLTYWPRESQGGQHVAAIAFAPDSKQLAYIRQMDTWQTSGHSGCFVMDRLEVRWYPTAHPEKERSLPFLSADFHAEGGVGSPLATNLSFSPDSTQFAAIVPDAALVVDVQTGQSRRLQYPNEWFTGLRWLSAHEIAFSTTQGDTKLFWRLDLTPGQPRRLVYRDRALHAGETSEESPGARAEQRRPLDLSTHLWAPNGRLVVSGSNIVDMMSGTTRPLSCTPEESDVFWRPDSSAFFLGWGRLVDATTGASQDLAAPIKKSLPDTVISMNGWTEDGKKIVVSIDGIYLFQAKPFRSLRKIDGFFQVASLEGRVLVVGDNAAKRWVDEAGTPISREEWHRDWTLSPDHSFAANPEFFEDDPISKDHLILFHPEHPSQ